MTGFECEDDDHERKLLEIIASIQKDYEKAAKPYVDRLVEIRQRRIHPRMMIVTAEQWQGLSISPESTP